MKRTTERKWHSWLNGVALTICPSMWRRQRRLWWTSGGGTPLTTPHWPSTARLWRESAALNSWGCTSRRISPGPPTPCHSPRRHNSAYTFSAGWKEQVSHHPSSPHSTGAPLRVCWPAASLSGTGTAVLLTARPSSGQWTRLQRSSMPLSHPSWTFSLHDAPAKPTASWRTPPTVSSSSYHQEDGTGASEPAPPDCSTAFSPRLWEPWTQITLPTSETPCKPLPPPHPPPPLPSPPNTPQPYHTKEKTVNFFLSIHKIDRLFTLLPSGKRFRSLMAKTERLRKSFFPRSSGSWTQTQPLNIIMTSLTNHSQSVIYSHSLLSTSYWQCHLHTTLSVSWYLILFFIFIIFVIAASWQPCSTVCTFLSRTVMLILIFNSTAYCHAHSFILYILYSVLYILFFIHFILCILPLCCIIQYFHCPWSRPDSHFTAGYTISV